MTLLGRSASPGEINSWVAAFQKGVSNEDVIAGFASSAEYFNDKGSGSAAWLDSAFSDILGRAPSVGELSAWLGSLALPANLTTAAYALPHSGEYYGQVIQAAYNKYLGRAASKTEVASWTQAMQNGLTDEQLESGFISSTEFINANGGLGAGWITTMYKDLLGRAPSQSEINSWLAALSKGTSPYQIAHGFAASAEREAIRIQNDYLTFLGRAATQAEINGWVAAFGQGVSNEEVIAGFVGSREYFDDKGQGSDAVWIGFAYRDIFGRNPSLAEVNGWVAGLD